uniref:Uncharacterized protein n=1 Tax=Cucumis melo TaxID=3656 RepID=A0A9I9EII7_CUCME
MTQTSINYRRGYTRDYVVYVNRDSQYSSCNCVEFDYGAYDVLIDFAKREPNHLTFEQSFLLALGLFQRSSALEIVLVCCL